ncbi:23S rRNA pseudouridine(2604) synthase RluF [Colwellia sp. MB02u-18]|uniref:23S rRNA pseudouridine(2604) synthase RluF n=1 Tax=unclassified Colwellia TaxID=196834 RepID=UPI0015F449DD|nr:MULTISPECIES: 23S rRNA pseudouridine(2604) synthase RluF [unclassified Colwellia]MBA6223609.1 23S rRNA pseudouridine(2604) synthase RluF [Colwellia sp. MB3u-45]MBA6267325.1 23S rRNA pseudouridine(2604) synthase RluF [Colwellia sp. MB3u-43]MBA6319790.1 23S rRNA pseudouridine(2604) synthase RluF [Colwellia sp. MB02u-19]MBA6323831.1 23S rRNA pseudouridine(2604) synthase RluF [Colwellia sp. MB02u-18]MBA6330821.1 23S rRNA pseudouridine(2604) synthase RluF [Colwellia sp. MB02u-12]
MSSYEKRLNKYISDSGYCSRRFADKLIENNRVTINGKVPELGTKVVSGDRVCIDGNEIKASASNHTDRVYIAYNKPIGITCTTERQVKGNIIDAIGHTKRIFPIGRLDKPSEGLIFLTSDGDIVNKILRAENAHDKEYIVKVDKPISERFVERMSKGVPILGTITKPCIVKHESKYVFRIILTQGLNRQIRRMCEYLDYEVIELQRSRIMNVELGNLRSGEWRDLTTSEMAEINTAVAGSRKTALGDDFTAVEVTEAASTEAANIDDDHAAVEVNAEVEKVAITDIKHASKTIASKSPAASRTLTRIDVKKPTATSSGKKRLSLKNKS